MPLVVQGAGEHNEAAQLITYLVKAIDIAVGFDEKIDSFGVSERCRKMQCCPSILMRDSV